MQPLGFAFLGHFVSTPPSFFFMTEGTNYSKHIKTHMPVLSVDNWLASPG